MDWTALIIFTILGLIYAYGLVYETWYYAWSIVGAIALIPLFGIGYCIVNMDLINRRSLRRRQFWDGTDRARKTRKSNDDLQRIENFKLPIQSQETSPLFTILPGEVRDIIYDYVFSDYEDLDHPYAFDTCYRRPGCYGPRKTDTAFLRTCQQVYQEAWYLPWTKAQHTFYFSTSDRHPRRRTNGYEVEQAMAMIYRLHPDIKGKRKETGHVQIYAQLYKIESTGDLQTHLNIPNFCPRSVTVTVRHTDCWQWEFDERLHIAAGWIRDTVIPTHVKTFYIQLESLERKQAQVDWMTTQMTEKWYFKRTDGSLMLPNKKVETETWTGGSTWSNERWVRDEEDTLPDMLKFYLATVTFHPSPMTEDLQSTLPRQPDLAVPTSVAPTINSVRGDYACLSTAGLRKAGVRPGTPASAAVRAVQQSRMVHLR